MLSVPSVSFAARWNHSPLRLCGFLKVNHSTSRLCGFLKVGCSLESLAITTLRLAGGEITLHHGFAASRRRDTCWNYSLLRLNGFLKVNHSPPRLRGFLEVNHSPSRLCGSLKMGYSLDSFAITTLWLPEGGLLVGITRHYDLNDIPHGTFPPCPNFIKHIPFQALLKTPSPV